MLIGFLMMPSMPSTALTGDTPPSVESNSGSSLSLSLARHRLLVDGVAIHQVFVGFRTQKDVVAPFDDDARFRLISWGDDLDDEERHESDQDRRPQNLPALAPESRAECREVQLCVVKLAPAPRRPRHDAHGDTPRDRTTDIPNITLDQKLLRLRSG